MSKTTKSPAFFQLSSITPESRVDEESGVIRGVSVITVGPALGHSFEGMELHIDRETIQGIKLAAGKYANGVKVKLNHNGGAGDIVGSLRNFREEGNQLLADLFLLSNTPHRAYLIELATVMPDTFGLSVSFVGAPKVSGGRALARCTRLRSADIVTEQAANASGLFEEGDSAVDNPNDGENQTTMTSEQFQAYCESTDTKLAALDSLLTEIKDVLPKKPTEQELAAKDTAEKFTALEAKLAEQGTLLSAQAETIRLFGKQAGVGGDAGAADGGKEKKFNDIVKDLIAGGKTAAQATTFAVGNHAAAYELHLKEIGVLAK